MNQADILSPPVRALISDSAQRRPSSVLVAAASRAGLLSVGCVEIIDTPRVVQIRLRDAALRRIIELHVTANNLKATETLLRAIQAISIRKDVLNEHKILRR